MIFLDASLADAMPRFDGVEHEVLMPDADATRDGALDYEQLVSDGDEGFEFPDVDERSAAALCYTSGTTGKPKGVLYSHRSTVLHAIGANQVRRLGISETDSVMPVVPMFHANAWGLPYIATNTPARGSSCPGPRMTPGRPRRAHRGGAGHLHRRRADDLAGHDAPGPRARPVLAEGDRVRRLGRARSR